MTKPYKEPDKKEFWISNGKYENITRTVHTTNPDNKAFIHVISADWVEAEITALRNNLKQSNDDRFKYMDEINKLKEENERYKAALKEIKKNSVIAYPDRLRKYINEVLKDE